MSDELEIIMPNPGIPPKSRVPPVSRTLTPNAGREVAAIHSVASQLRANPTQKVKDTVWPSLAENAAVALVEELAGIRSVMDEVLSELKRMNLPPGP